MNCEWVKNNGTLYMYDELPDDARYELEQHIGRCESCAKEVAELRELHVAKQLGVRFAPIARPDRRRVRLAWASADDDEHRESGRQREGKLLDDREIPDAQLSQHQ